MRAAHDRGVNLPWTRARQIARGIPLRWALHWARYAGPTPINGNTWWQHFWWALRDTWMWSIAEQMIAEGRL